MRPETATTIRLEDYRPTPYRITKVHLDIKLAPKETQVDTTIQIEKREDTAAGTPLVLVGDGLTFTGLKLNGEDVPESDYAVTPDRLELLTPPEEPFDLEIGTRLNPDENTVLMGLYRSSGNYCTQCEAEGFRRITYFLDRPDNLAVYTTRLEGPRKETPVLLANGNLIERGKVPGTDHIFAVWHDPHPKPSYLFAMVAGNLACVSDTFTTCSGREVQLGIFVEHGKEGFCDWAMASLKRAMKWDEDAFGREYDLDVFNLVAVSDFNMGAMENKGLNVFNDKYVLANPDTATDQDYASIEGVIGHEYFHNWTGDRITCRDWFQLCLKEGLTVFRDQEFSSDMRSRAVKRITDARFLKAHQFPEDGGPLAHPVRPRAYQEINNFYTTTVYEKGAEVVRMLKTLIGDEAFSKGMTLYFDRHDGSAATIEDFIECFAEVSGRDLSQFMLWYEQAGTPKVDVRTSYDADARTYTLALTQTPSRVAGQTNPKPQVIPLRFALLGDNGKDLDFTGVTGATVKGDVIELDAAATSVVFSGVGEKPVLSILRGFSAPVLLTTDLTSDDLKFLARHDSDPYNRWQAVQTLAMQDLVRLTNAARKGEVLTADEGLVKTFGEIATRQDLDPAFRALALTLPSEGDIAQELGSNVDPDAILAARSALIDAIGTAHRQIMVDLAETRSAKAPYSPDPVSAGHRSLKAVAMTYMAASGCNNGTAAILRHFQDADNMTDRLSALVTMVHHNLPGAASTLEAFYERHRKHPLAIDKWLTVQATAPLADTLDKVIALTSHPGFDYKNPNRIRSLIGAFAAGNQSQFCRADGKGFEFVAGHVLEIDKRNPQVAARLLSSFRSWKALEPGRAEKAKKVLEHIAGTENLSKDAREIVERCLG